MLRIPKWLIAWIWLRVFRWRRDSAAPACRRYVLVAAPHTSNWDMPHMIAFGWVMGIQPSWLGKHTLFAPPFGWFMRWLGGIPIDRRAPQGTVGQLVERFGDPDKPFVLVIPPEGRSPA